jgi:hypothetical protein
MNQYGYQCNACFVLTPKPDSSFLIHDGAEYGD